MKIAKAKYKGASTFNDYEVELSWGQLMAIHAALEKDHANPLSDELFAELSFYLENVPGPGESEEEYKAAREAETQAIQGGEEGRNMSQLGQEVQAGSNGEDMDGTEPPVEDLGPDGAGQERAFDAGEQSGAESEADELLAAPPRE